MPSAAIGLMARYPLVNTTKTRLAKSVGDEYALRVYRSLLNQAHRLVTGLSETGYYRAVFVTPAKDCSAFESAYPGFECCYQQQGKDLGERMQNALTILLSDSDVDAAMLIGTDCPELNAELIDNAVFLLGCNDLVLGPTTDGGYYLIGMKKVYAEVFSEINWGTSSVINETLMAAKFLGLSTAMLPQLRDLDNVQDLEYFNRMELI